MEDVSCNIYPPYKPKVLPGNRITIRPIEIKLFQSIKLLIQIYNDSSNEIIDTKIYEITDDEYKNWSNDDNYIIKLLKDKIQI